MLRCTCQPLLVDVCRSWTTAHFYIMLLCIWKLRFYNLQEYQSIWAGTILCALSQPSSFLEQILNFCQCKKGNFLTISWSFSLCLKSNFEVLRAHWCMYNIPYILPPLKSIYFSSYDWWSQQVFDTWGLCTSSVGGILTQAAFWILYDSPFLLWINVGISLSS